jgi:hypothetical protein
MSLGTHGYDRDVDRAQHLFCHGTEEQLAQLAPAPGSEKNAICLELADSGCNLSRGEPLADYRIAGNTVQSGLGAPGFQGIRALLLELYTMKAEPEPGLGICG